MKYVQVRFPKEAYDNLLQKRQKIEEELRGMTRGKVRVPLTKVLIAITAKPVFLDNDYLKSLIGRKR